MPGVSPQQFIDTLTFTLDGDAVGDGYWTSAYEWRGSFFGVLAGLTGGALTDGAAIAINADAGNFRTFTAANDNVRVFGVPTGGKIGSWVDIYLTNGSGGNLTGTTFHGDIIQGTVTLMATATSRWYRLLKISATVWALVSQSEVDLS